MMNIVSNHPLCLQRITKHFQLRRPDLIEEEWKHFLFQHFAECVQISVEVLEQRLGCLTVQKKNKIIIYKIIIYKIIDWPYSSRISKIRYYLSSKHYRTEIV